MKKNQLKKTIVCAAIAATALIVIALFLANSRDADDCSKRDGYILPPYFSTDCYE